MPANHVAFPALKSRMAKLQASVDWVGAGRLRVAITPAWYYRRLYFAMLVTGCTGFKVDVRLGLSRYGSDVFKMNDTLSDSYSLAGFAGSSGTWEDPIGVGAVGMTLLNRTGLPAFIVDPDNSTTGLPTDGIGQQPDCIQFNWINSPDAGATTILNRVVCLPFFVACEADEAFFEVTSANKGTTTATPSLDVFLGVKSNPA
jgi:hypothetical protein